MLAAYEELATQNWNMSEVTWTGCMLLSENKAQCYFFKPHNTGHIYAYRFGLSCDGQYTYNVATGICESPTEPQESKEKGVPPPLACIANPINLTSGNKFQEEIDLAKSTSTPHFSRYYNSSDGLWSHSYATRLALGEKNITLIRHDGYQSSFSLNGIIIEPEANELGKLTRESSTWAYTSPYNETLIFDLTGRLIKKTLPSGIVHNIYYPNNSIIVTSSLGGTLSFQQDSRYQPTSLTAAGMSATYSYNTYGRLINISKIINNQTQVRQYHYEVPSKPNLLTGITDERGVRHATWAYDDQDRAISSEHADGADKVTLTYNTDGSTTVTNELGKKATYRFETIQGIRRIVAIEGEPTPNCPNSNSSFTYDNRGLLKTKTDNKGILTTYDYNDRGLEVSRTEAAGTPQARTTTTTWHPTLFLPLTVTEAGRTTHYQYDNQGRQISQTTDSL